MRCGLLALASAATAPLRAGGRRCCSRARHRPLLPAVVCAGAFCWWDGPLRTMAGGGAQRGRGRAVFCQLRAGRRPSAPNRAAPSRSRRPQRTTQPSRWSVQGSEAASLTHDRAGAQLRAAARPLKVEFGRGSGAGESYTVVFQEGNLGLTLANSVRPRHREVSWLCSARDGQDCVLWGVRCVLGDECTGCRWWCTASPRVGSLRATLCESAIVCFELCGPA